MEIELLAVVKVDPDKRIRCMAPGCTHTVYARIHVLRDDGELRLVGSTCFEKFYGDICTELHPYHAVFGEFKVLTEEETQMLTQNTEELLARFKLEFETHKQANQNKLEEFVEELQKTDNPNSSISANYKSWSNDKFVPKGKSRDVICRKCGNDMQTEYLYSPAIGYTCNPCLDDLINHKAYRN